MEYSTNDLSKILDVSTNTIRRFEEKGFLNAKRNNENGYRTFSDSDFEKIIYISKYRKIGFSHDEIGDIFNQGIVENKTKYLKKMEEIDKQIKYYTAIRHMVKDDMLLMSRIEEYGDKLFEFNCTPVYYILYQNDGKIELDGENKNKFHKIMYECPEIEYLYMFKKENVENKIFSYSQGICINQEYALKYEINVSEPVKLYERQLCLMKFIRIPIDISDEASGELKRFLFEEIEEYNNSNGYKICGDVLGIKVGFSREENKEWQYLLLSCPIKK